MKIQMLLGSSAVLLLCACTSSRHLAVGEKSAGTCGAAAQPDGCQGPCSAEVRCLPNGNCQVSCTGPEGKRCEVEIPCGEGCR